MGMVGTWFVLPARALANRSRCCCRKRAVRLQPCKDRVASRGQADSRQARAWVCPSPSGFMLRFSSSRHYHRRKKRDTEMISLQATALNHLIYNTYTR